MMWVGPRNIVEAQTTAMATLREQLLRRAREGQRESKNLDFKVGFDIRSREDWCEIIKDIVAFANSGGGALVFGVNDDGTPAGVDVEPYLRIDPADVTNKVNAYTGHEFDEFEIIPVERNGHRVALFAVYGVTAPMVFVKNGAHLGEGSRRRPAFVKGAVYFRHGAKSEPGTSNDLRHWLDRSLDEICATWLGGIREVVEAGIEQRVQVVRFEESGNASISARIVNEPSGVAVVPQNPQELWPYKEGDLVRRMASELPAGTRFNSHDVRSIRLAHGIAPDSHPKFVFKPHEKSSPQYSAEFVEWIRKQHEHDGEFLDKARLAYRDARHQS